MTDILRPSDVTAMNQVIEASTCDGFIMRMIDDTRYQGTVRGLRETASGTGNAFGTDVRDLFVHVTLTNGVDVFWPMRDVASAIQERECIVRRPATPEI